MKSSPASGPPVTIGKLVRRRLREMERTVDDLAAAVEVPIEYIEDVIAGVRQPALGRSDIYARMTSFLRLGRNDIANCIADEDAPVRAGVPGVQVRRMLLALCDTKKAEELEQRRAEHGGAELTGLCRRLLDVAQGAVRRILEDHARLRLAAAECGRTYPAMRFHVLDFLDATPGTVTLNALNEFLAPRIARWDVELETGVLRVVMRNADRRSAPKGRALSPPGASRPDEDA
ncbi:MAG TPA: hypothetical protein VLV16_13110 [Gemmatimonadales bacterium]|nr:hypothetical protein [Gemmatimonadales bacterium]